MERRSHTYTDKVGEGLLWLYVETETWENFSHVHAQNFLQKTYSEITILLKIFASILVSDIDANIFKMLSLKG